MRDNIETQIKANELAIIQFKLQQKWQLWAGDGGGGCYRSVLSFD